MNYRNGKPLGTTILPGGGGNKVKPENCTLSMTFEELEKTWKGKGKGHDEAGYI